MRGGALPPALLCAALACALAFAPRRALAPSLIALVIAAILAHLFRAGGPWTEAIFLGCWISVVVIAATVHLPRGLPTWGAVAAGLLAGTFCGAVTAVAGSTRDLAIALPCVLLVLPARWLAAGRGAIAVKVLGSWLIAVSILAGAVPVTPTPGYMPDHME